MKKIYQLLGIIITLLVSSSCATFKMHISNTEQDWANKTVPNLTVSHSVFLIGDAGNAALGESTPALKLLKTQLDHANANSSVVFLGDNIYPVGMPPKAEVEDRKLAEHSINAQLDALKNFKGKPIFLPGNHDWYRYGIKGVHRQEKYIEKHLNADIADEDDWNNYFFPDNACSGPDVIEINDKLVIIVIDSNWFVLDWDKYPNINNGCDIKTRKGFAEAFNAVIRKNKSKNIIVAMHHPIMSNGTHGGHYSFRQHIFPVPGPGKHIPLPVLGTVANGLRAVIGSRQDITHSIYQEMIDDLLKPAMANGEFVFAAGHEHNLQYFKDIENGQHFIVSGAGSKKSATVGGNGAKFSYGGYGFSKIDYYQDGSAWMEFWSPTEDGKGELVYKTKLKGKFKQQVDDIPTKFPIYESKPVTYNKKPILTPVEPVGHFHSWLLGKHYRAVYNEKYDFKTLDLGTHKDGLTILKKGGGLQTNSLRLQAGDGHQYVMRSLTKDESRAVPAPFNRMRFISFIFKDFYLSAHPFSALPVPTLADACNVYHANPKIFFIPKQPRLGVHNDLFGDEVYIFEERAGGNWSDLASFGNSKKVISTHDVALKLQKNHKHHIDEKWVARSRLFDLMIGDWDRHDDQWRWMEIIDEDGHKVHRPIPRDRDQAFSKYDGVLVKILRPLSPFVRQIADYREELGSMKWATNNTRHFDHAFLTELTLDEWKAEAKFLKTNLTDAIIDEAFTYFPAKAQELSADRIKEVLKYRRNHLEETAERFYKQLSKKVAVVGSEKRDFFEVIRQDDMHTLVRVYALSKKEKKDEVHFERLFNNVDTKEVFLYGLDGDDQFLITGDVSKSIIVRIVGGADNDVINDRSKVGRIGKKTKIYDTKIGNTIDFGSEAKNNTSNVVVHNVYDRRGNQFDNNITVPFPILGFNADDGFLLGFSTLTTKNGFFKRPYGERHDFGIDYAFATNGLRVNYSGEFINAKGKWDFVVNTKAFLARYAFNYYGWGNESIKTTDDLDYNRVRQTHISLDVGWQRRFAGNYGRFSIRPLVQFNDIEETTNRFIVSDSSDLDDTDFDSEFNAGIISELEFENVDDLSSPHRGIRFNAMYSWQTSVDNAPDNFHKIGINGTGYHSIGIKSPLTLASQIGAETIRGEYQFYFAPTLGQTNNLRGFRPERFRGGTTFYHITDLRWELFSSKNSILPFSFGIFGSFDHGRVWERQGSSKKWHYSYGGGFWIAPLDYIVLSFGMHRSDENDLFQFRVGHSF